MKLDDLKYYDKEFLCLENIKLDNNEKIELLIYLVNISDLEIDIDNYYLLLGGRGLITLHNFNRLDYLIQNARILLKTLNQKKVYLDALKDYENNQNGEFENLYYRSGNRFIKREDISKRTYKREELYNKLLSLQIKFELKKDNYALQDNKRYGIIIDDKVIEIKDCIETSPKKLIIENRKKTPKINIKVDDLIEEAAKLDKVLSPEKSYREKIIRENRIKKLKDNKYKDINEITINKLTNIVGQVGAGKTTFVDALLKRLSRENKKVILIQPTVNKVLEKNEELNNVSINSVAVIGETLWSEHIEKARDGREFLKDSDSKILLPGCILGGMINEYDKTIEYGKEPCKNIYKYYERGINKNTLDRRKSYNCPYYYKCPRTQRQKEIIDADVIVTTTPALINMSIGISGITLFQYALENIDLIIVDEAESELIKADTCFSPIVSYDDYIINNGHISSDYYMRDFSKRTDKSEENKRKFLFLFAASERAFTKIHLLLREEKQGIAKSELKKPFTGNMLINTCRVRELLPQVICNDLSRISDVRSKKRYKIILDYVSDIKNERDLIESFDEYEWGTDEKLNKIQINIIIFILNVLAFEDAYRKISNLVEGNYDLPTSTKEIVSQRFEFQQRYVPLSPMGNIFALQYKQYESTGNADLYIVKQFAMGRSMYLRFPWLKIDEEGNQLGPNVLLLSGSSFAPNSFANHINEPVNYIIESEQYKRDFISDSKFEFIDVGINVSGSGDERYENLRRLVNECKELILDKLDDDNNILMIVNSYKDAESVKNQLKIILKDTCYKNEISYLVSDSEEEDSEKIRQSNVSDFNKKKSRILVAPAILIERGHNIVDSKGNSVFDILMFMTRPMNNPNDFKSHVPKVNGYIASKYMDLNYKFDTNIFSNMRKDANSLYYDLDNSLYGLSNLKPKLKNDIVSTLFVMMLQIFGRLCRIGDENDIKAKSPEVYFLDSSFKATKTNKFDFLNELVDYLDKIINESGKNGEVARTLYEPFYNALKRGKNIYD